MPFERNLAGHQDFTWQREHQVHRMGYMICSGTILVWNVSGVEGNMWVVEVVGDEAGQVGWSQTSLSILKNFSFIL